MKISATLVGLTLLATAASGQVSYSPQPINFGSVKLGATSATLSSTLTNTGTDTLRFPGGSSMSPPTVPESGCSSTGFCWVTDNCTARAPGASCVLQYRFTPKRVGAVTGANIVQTSHGPFPVNFTGTGLDTVTAPANKPPVAAFSSSCAGLTCTFLSTSSDPDGTISAQSWAFGDGGSGTGGSPSHTYGAGGTYSVRLTVTDNQLAQGSLTQSVTVTAPPPPPTVVVSTVTVVPTGLTLTPGAMQHLYGVVTQSDGSARPTVALLHWTSSDTTVATVDSIARVVARGAGLAVVTATDVASGRNGTATITVAGAAPPVTFGVRASWLFMLLPGCTALPGTRCGRVVSIIDDATGAVLSQAADTVTFLPP